MNLEIPQAKVFIVKTYPQPSSRYGEFCTAGLLNGEQWVEFNSVSVFTG